MHVKYRATHRQTPPGDINRPAEATDLGPSTAICIRSALDAKEAPVEAAMAGLLWPTTPGSSSAATVLGSFEFDVRDMAMCYAIKNGTPEVALHAIEAV